MREQELQWGSAALRCRPPLLSLLQQPGGPDAAAQGSCRRLGAHATAITALMLHRPADGGPTTILSADCDGRLKVWQLRGAALALLATHTLHSGPINCMELHQANGVLATAGDDGCIRLWRLPQLLQPGKRQQGSAQAACWAGQGASVTACCFTHCGRFLASASRDGTVRLWQVSAHEPLAVLRLHAASLAFAPGEDAALLVAPDGAAVPSSFGQAGSFGRAPVLLNLRSLPACRLYCSQLAAAQQGGSLSVQPAQHAMTIDPAVAVWLPSGGTPQRPSQAAAAASAAAGAPAAAGASVAAPTPTQPQPSSRTPGSVGGSEDSARRQVGRLATFGRRRQHREQQQPGRPAAEEASGSNSWLPPDDTPVRPPLAASSRGMPLLASPLPSPLSPAAGEAGLDAAVVAVYDAPLASSGSRWDPARRSYVAQHGGHAAPVCSILPLPTGLHVLTADEHGIAKLWGPSGGSGSSEASGSSGSSGGSRSSGGSSTGSRGSLAICCTLLPRAKDQASGGPRCRPVVTPDGRHVLCGTPTGHVAVWEVEYAQQPAAAPPDQVNGNAAACCRIASCTVTAVAWDAGSCLLAAGDAAGHLALRWL